MKPLSIRYSTKSSPLKSISVESLLPNNQGCLNYSSSLQKQLSSSQTGTPTGIRTPVAAVKGQCPRPLDDGRTRLADYTKLIKNVNTALSTPPNITTSLKDPIISKFYPKQSRNNTNTHAHNQDSISPFNQKIKLNYSASSIQAC